MSFQAIIKFQHEGGEYLTIQTNHVDHAHDMVLSSVYMLLALLDFTAYKFDDDVIDNLIRRVEELRNCPHQVS